MKAKSLLYMIKAQRSTNLASITLQIGLLPNPSKGSFYSEGTYAFVMFQTDEPNLGQ